MVRFFSAKLLGWLIRLWDDHRKITTVTYFSWKSQYYWKKMESASFFRKLYLLSTKASVKNKKVQGVKHFLRKEEPNYQVKNLFNTFSLLDTGLSKLNDRSGCLLLLSKTTHMTHTFEHSLTRRPYPQHMPGWSLAKPAQERKLKEYDSASRQETEYEQFLPRPSHSIMTSPLIHLLCKVLYLNGANLSMQQECPRRGLQQDNADFPAQLLNFWPNTTLISVVLCWPFRYMQDPIPDRLLYNENHVFLLFTSCSLWWKIKWLLLWYPVSEY